MADQKGTGKHPHKDTKEPWAHHEAPTTRNEGREDRSTHSQHRNEERRDERERRDKAA